MRTANYSLEGTYMFEEKIQKMTGILRIDRNQIEGNIAIGFPHPELGEDYGKVVGQCEFEGKRMLRFLTIDDLEGLNSPVYFEICGGTLHNCKGEFNGQGILVPEYLSTAIEEDDCVRKYKSSARYLDISETDGETLSLREIVDGQRAEAFGRINHYVAFRPNDVKRIDVRFNLEKV